MSRSYRFALSVLALLMSTEGVAQEHPNLGKGFATDKLYQSEGPDSINTFNGNLNITIPIGPRYPVNGALSYGLQLVYNAKPWASRQDCIASGPQAGCYNAVWPSESSNAGLGWSIGMGRLLSPNDTYNTSGLWVYESPDGSQHTFFPTLHNGEPVVSDVFYTRDGTYLRMKNGPADPLYGYPSRDIEFPDGTIHRFYFLIGSEQRSEMRDRFGNWVRYTWNFQDFSYCNPTCPPLNHTLTITDSHGRTHYARFQSGGDAPTNMRLTQVDLAGFNNSRSVYTFTNTPTTIERGCFDNHPHTSVTMNLALLTAIGLPDGSSYAMPVHDTVNTISPGLCTSGYLASSVCPRSARWRGTIRPIGFRTRRAISKTGAVMSQGSRSGASKTPTARFTASGTMRRC